MKTATKSETFYLIKETYLKYCQHFVNIPVDKLKDDPIVIEYFKTLITNNNALCNKAFQLALDVSYSGKKYNSQELIKIFKNKFSIKNALDPNDSSSFCDQSTLYSMLQSEITKKFHPFWNIDVNLTPTSNINESISSSEKLFQKLLTNQRLSGNKIPDVVIDGVPHDFKHQKGVSLTKNEIYIMPECLTNIENFQKYLYDTIKFLDRDQCLLPAQYRREILSKAVELDLELKAQKNTNINREMITDWNDYLIKTIEKRKNTQGIPLFILTDPYVPDLKYETQKLKIPEGHLDQVKTKKVLFEITKDYPEELKKAISEITKGSLHHILEYIDK